ncbi:hypothetical protein ACFVVP_33220 [Streptomyces sp. NPDC058128]|uniref:hypothetical protein n=1 Tax=Streptomyces sp. NPDC058128 TaxID=3346352 RepID=UPI0036EF04E9
MGRIPANVRAQIPGHDIVHAHRSPMLVPTLTTGMALGMGALSGLEGTDALMAGILGLPSIPGIVSLGWWAAVALVPFKLRTVRRRKHRPAQSAASVPGTDGGVYPPNPHLVPATPADEILQRWAQYISHPTSGPHRGQELALRTISPERWTGLITAPVGTIVNVTRENVSSVF